jgi:hypothetical protein
VRRLTTPEIWLPPSSISGACIDRLPLAFLAALGDVVVAYYANGLDPSAAVLIGASDSSDRLVEPSEAHRTSGPRALEVPISVDLSEAQGRNREEPSEGSVERNRDPTNSNRIRGSTGRESKISSS